MARKKNGNGEELETTLDVFLRNYRNVPGFRALVKLGLWTIFFLFIIVVALSYNPNKDDDNESKTTTNVVEKSTYKEILDKYINNVRFTINITNQDERYLIDGNIQDNILSGTYETKDITTRFIIKNNKVYEVKMNEENENNDLFSEFNLDFININNLINILENNKSIKTTEDIITKYTYEIDNYNIIVNIIDEKINNIIINNDSIEYNIVLEI